MLGLLCCFFSWFCVVVGFCMYGCWCTDDCEFVVVVALCVSGCFYGVSNLVGKHVDGVGDVFSVGWFLIIER